MYQQKGTDPGIVNAIRFFLGIEVTVTAPASGAAVLGTGTLGGTFTLGTSDLTTILTFYVNVPRVLTETEIQRMSRLVRFMKRGETYYQIRAPEAPTVLDHWALGASALGSQTILHT